MLTAYPPPPGTKHVVDEQAVFLLSSPKAHLPVLCPSPSLCGFAVFSQSHVIHSKPDYSALSSLHGLTTLPSPPLNHLGEICKPSQSPIRPRDGQEEEQKE